MTAHAVLAVTFPVMVGAAGHERAARDGCGGVWRGHDASPCWPRAARHRLGLAWLACALAGLGFTADPTGLHAVRTAARRTGRCSGRSCGWPAHRTSTALLGAGRRVGRHGRAAARLRRRWSARLPARTGDLPFPAGSGELDHRDPALHVFLFSQIPMGNYAKRAAVLVCLVAPRLVRSDRGRGHAPVRVAVPTPLWLGRLHHRGSRSPALWLTPSKWTEHFGAARRCRPGRSWRCCW